MKSTLTRCLVLAACCWSVSAAAESEPTQPPMEIQGECAVDSDCPANFTCESDSFASCPPCADDGSVCALCEPQSYSYCMPPPPTPCSADADCDGGDVCVSYTYETCSGTGVGYVCPSEGPCEVPPVMEEEPTCEAQTEAYCVPRYVAPCQAAADCGPGFTCDAYESCACSGSGGVPRDGQTEPDVQPDCICEPSGEKYCQVIVVECDTNADCAQDLECISGPSETTVSVDPDGSDTMSTDPAPAPVSYCLPPGYGYWGGTSGGDVVAQESGVNGTLSTSDRISWGTNASDGSGSKGTTDGCSTTKGDASLSLLGLLGLVGWFRRRR